MCAARRIRAAVGVCLALVVCQLTMVAVAGAAPLAIAHFTVQTTQGGQPPGYEYEPYAFDRAGGHPFALTSTVEFATEPYGSGGAGVPTADPRDFLVQLPPGLLANPQAVPRCSARESQACPVASQLGVFVLDVDTEGRLLSLMGAIVNLVPGPGEAAKLGLETQLGRFLLSGQLARTPSGYALEIAAHGLPRLAITRLQMTLWGVPAAAAHDAERGIACERQQANSSWNCSPGAGQASGLAEAPFLTLPSECSANGLELTAWTDSWEQPGEYVRANATLPAVVGCEQLPFAAEARLLPDNREPGAPVALDVQLGVEQPAGAARATPAPLRGALVTLPAGLTIDPAGVAGARPCAARGPEGIGIPTGVDAAGQPLSPGQAGEGETIGSAEYAQLAPGNCPNASTIGTVEALSPLLAHPLLGRVYLGAPGCGALAARACADADAADGNLLHVYLELGGRGDEDDEGIVIKLEGRVLVNSATGQLTLALSEAPQLPLGRLEIKLFGGAVALLDNPAGCEPVQASAVLEAWSAPFTPLLALSSPYPVEGCVLPAPFRPALVAGSVSSRADSFTAFTATVARGQREQSLSQLQLLAPPGLSAQLTGVETCAEPAAGEGACPAAARIGSSTVAVGGGTQLLRLPGQVYLTGGYGTAPFGLAIVTQAAAGPIDLGRLVIRARLDVDPRTGALTIASDRLPQMLFGVPLRVREVVLAIDRPGFVVNPTNCRAQRVTAMLAGGEGALSTPSSPFAVGGCRALGFAPKLTASTSARTSIGDGAGLDVALSQAAGPGSGQANLARLRLALPRQLPIRLSALRSSCRTAVFAADPAACPAASIVGVAQARTPLLAGTLTGPVYLVAHGRSAFPAPTVVLEGDGVRLDLVGTSDVERSGGVEIAFQSLPDMPLRSVELQLPRGPHSVLAAAGNLCVAGRSSAKSTAGPDGGGTPAPTLSLPVELVAQNGFALHRRERIAVLGCQRTGAGRHNRH